MTIRIIRLFGACRKYEDKEPVVRVDLPDDATVHALKEILLNHIPDRNLVEESAIADDQNILLCHEVIGERTNLAILPPVCGG